MAHDVKLGQLIDESQERDAIHIAVAPVIAAMQLEPGQHVGFVKGSTTKASWQVETKIGIVDPFLKDSVKAGGRCFMLLYPQTITSLRHDWSHPEFPQIEPPSYAKQQSEVWLRKWADDNELEYGQMLADLRSQGQVCSRSDSVYETDEDAWRLHVQAVLGNVAISSSPYRCAC